MSRVATCEVNESIVHSPARSSVAPPVWKASCWSSTGVASSPAPSSPPPQRRMIVVRRTRSSLIGWLRGSSE